MLQGEYLAGSALQRPSILVGRYIRIVSYSKIVVCAASVIARIAGFFTFRSVEIA